MRRFVVFLVAAVLAACATSASPNGPSLPEEFRGRWYYTGSSGGIAGDGAGDAATGYIVIKADNTIDHHKEDGTRVSTSTFTPSRGKTIYTSDDQWLMTPAGGSALDVPEVIRVSADGKTLTIADNAYDGFTKSYVRSR